MREQKASFEYRLRDRAPFKGGIIGSAVLVRAFLTSVRFKMPLVVEVPSEWGAVLLGGL